jgi:cytochrome c oxidase subunit 1
VVGDERVGAGLFYLGYLLLSVGLLLIAVAAIATPLAAVSDGRIEEWSAATFATVAWAGLLAVSAAAAVYAFLPPALWVAGLAAEPADHANNWHLLFHNLHYLPLMGTILIWYVLAESLIGMRSIYGTRYSKVVFASYLIFVPPTSLYHMFLEPGLTATVRVMGSLLSLFVGVPTILAFLIIVMSLEATARAAGARGAFGWLRALPWRDPVMSAMGMAAFNLAFGGVFAFVLIQEQLAPLLSDTFFVPAYFHFLTAGTVTLTLLAALAYAMPALSGRSLPWRRLSVALPYTATAGILIFAFAGLIAGFQGIPRRTLDVGYEGSAAPGWTIWLGLIGAGAAVMAASLLGYAAVLAAILFGRRRTPSDVPVVAVPRSVDLGRPLGSAWSAPVSILVLLFGMYAATAAAFIVMRGLPLVAAGGSAH